MADPKISIKKILVFEGGWVNNPNDNGKETFRGVTRVNWPNWKGWAIIDEAKKHSNFPESLMTNLDLTNMVIDFYTVNYWNKIHGNQINDQQTADSFLDQAVLEGVSAAIKREENSVNIPVTGIISDLLISKLNSLV